MRTPRAISERAFTLLEILMVLAIMSILTVLTVAASSLFRSGSLSSAGNQMADVVAMARQNSISQNAYTAVVIKTQGTGANSAYCLLQMTRQDDGTLSNWTALTPWRYLSAGVVFENSQPSVDTFMSTSASLPQALPTNFNFQGQSIDLTNPAMAVVQCYEPDGTLVGEPSLRLRLIQGMANASTGTSTYQGQTVSGQEVSYYDIVFVGNTGSTIIQRP